MLPEEFQAARLRLVKERPYLASALWAMTPVERPGLKTLAVDRWWRLYYDPAVADEWKVEELAGVLYHEVCHLLRNHSERMANFDDPVLANEAADAEINDGILREGVKLPGNSITPAVFGLPENLFAEEYYAELEKMRRNLMPGAGGAQPGSKGDGADSQPGLSRDSKPGDVGGQDGSSAVNDLPASSGQLLGGSGQLASSSQFPADSGESHGSGAGWKEPGKEPGEAQVPAPGAGWCGSCATGRQAPWEDGPPSSSSQGVKRAQAELIRREVARQIQEHSRTRGDIPGHWARWAETLLRPKVNWRRELAAAIRHAVADVAGAVDYSYRKPSRRQGASSDVVLPALRQPVPSVAVVVDTSGSMSDGMLSQALAEVSGILKGMGQKEGVHVFSCDAQVHACRKVFRASQVQLAGGGGTDMGAGLAAAARLKPVPQVAIVITDGYTPWPDDPPRGVGKVVVALVGDGDAPAWAKRIKLI